MKKVLLIEDDLDTVAIVDIILQEEGFVVININWEIHVEEIAAIDPNMVIVDYLLPFMRGNDICAQIKSSPKTKDIPVILYSANYLASRVAKECNADAFMHKPLDINEFKELIKRLAVGKK